MNQSNSTGQETIADLQPETEYMVGVLLFTDDLNYNDQDIVYGNFTTTCIGMCALVRCFFNI